MSTPNPDFLAELSKNPSPISENSDTPKFLDRKELSENETLMVSEDLVIDCNIPKGVKIIVTKGDLTINGNVGVKPKYEDHYQTDGKAKDNKNDDLLIDPTISTIRIEVQNGNITIHGSVLENAQISAPTGNIVIDEFVLPTAKIVKGDKKIFEARKMMVDLVQANWQTGTEFLIDGSPKVDCEEWFRLLIEAGVNLNFKEIYSRKQTLLTEALSKGNIACATLLMRAGITLQVTGDRAEPILEFAREGNCEEEFLPLLTAEIASRQSAGKTSSLIETENKRDLFLFLKDLITDKLYDKDFPLAIVEIAIQVLGDYELSKEYLDDNGKQLRHKYLAKKELLMKAASNGKIDHLKLLIKAGASVTADVIFEQSALNLALLHKQLGCAQILVDIDPNMSRDYAISLLPYAEEGNCFPAFKEVLVQKNIISAEDEPTKLSEKPPFLMPRFTERYLESLSLDQREHYEEALQRLKLAIQEQQWADYLRELTAWGLINIKDGFGDTLLELALKAGRIDLASDLMDAGIIIQVTNGTFVNPITKAARQGRCIGPFLDLIRKKFEDREAKEAEERRACLIDSSDKRKLYKFVLMLIEDKQFNDQDYPLIIFSAAIQALGPNYVYYAASETLLMKAIKHGKMEYVQVLIAAGASVNHKFGHNETALSMALKYRQMPCVESLLNAGAILQITGVGCRPITEYAREGRCIGPFLKLLQKRYVEQQPYVQSGRREKPGLKEIAENEKMGQLPPLVDTTDEFILVIFVEELLFSGSFKDQDFPVTIRKIMLQQIIQFLGSDTIKNLTGLHGRTLLMGATEHGKVEYLQLLIDTGIDVNAQTVFNETALTMAIAHGYLDCAKVLLSSGARLETTGSFAKYILDYAEEGRCVSGFKTLLAEMGISLPKFEDKSSLPEESYQSKEELVAEEPEFDAESPSLAAQTEMTEDKVKSMLLSPAANVLQNPSSSPLSFLTQNDCEGTKHSTSKPK